MVDWPAAQTIQTARLTLEPLRVEHAEQMFAVLDDERLHAFVGGHPLTRDQLRERYARLTVGHSDDGRQGWLNWMLRERATGRLVGTVQATLSGDSEAPAAELAWVVGAGAQGRGYATEAALAMLQWLAAHNVTEFTAHIHPSHVASGAVARRIGLTATARVTAGETLWARSSEPNPR